MTDLRKLKSIDERNPGDLYFEQESFKDQQLQMVSQKDSDQPIDEGELAQMTNESFKNKSEKDAYNRNLTEYELQQNLHDRILSQK